MANRTVEVIEGMVQEISVAAEGSRAIGEGSQTQVAELGRFATHAGSLFATPCTKAARKSPPPPPSAKRF